MINFSHIWVTTRLAPEHFGPFIEIWGPFHPISGRKFLGTSLITNKMLWILFEAKCQVSKTISLDFTRVWLTAQLVSERHVLGPHQNSAPLPCTLICKKNLWTCTIMKRILWEEFQAKFKVSRAITSNFIKIWETARSTLVIFGLYRNSRPFVP